MRYEVGQRIWIADFSPMAPAKETCPDCGGTGRLRVIFHDESQVSIECRNCAAGYDPPTGHITVYRNRGLGRQAVVCGFENSHGQTRWHVDGSQSGYRIVDDEDAFDTEADALACAEVKAEKYEAEQREKLRRKEKDTRTWAWNASYHRNQIKRATREIEYHTAKMNVAAIKAKEPVSA